jgi:hypothetical protein
MIPAVQRTQSWHVPPSRRIGPGRKKEPPGDRTFPVMERFVQVARLPFGGDASMRCNLIALLAGISVMALAGGALAQETSESDAAAAEQTRQIIFSSNDLASAKVEHAMAPNELGGATTETATTTDIDMDGYIKKAAEDPMKDAGERTIAAGDLALKSKGYEGGMAAQGINTGQITEATTFDGVMPQVASTMVRGVMNDAMAAFK